MHDAIRGRGTAQPRAILFDLDGTLDDRSRSVARYAQHFHAAFADRLAVIAAADLTALIQTADGDGYRIRDAVSDDLRRQLPWLTTPALLQLTDHWRSWFPISAAPRDGLEELLQALQARGILLGVVTNGGVRMQQTKIEQLGIGRYLSTIVISEAVQIAKPDPGIFLHALAEVGCAPAEAWFVGDHPLNDVFGASTAGLRGIWLPALLPWPAELPAPAWQIASLGDVLALVESLGS
ncbi:MAG: HAD family hydrolase [Dehalococcoidia bacterium]